MSDSVLIFGHGAPLEAPVLAGLPLADVTRERHLPGPASRVAPLLEPFLDPFVRSFLFGLESGAHQGAAIVVWRQGAGALQAYRYACELRRLGLLPPGAPLILWNRGDAGFDAVQDQRLAQALAAVPRGPVADRRAPLADLALWQGQGRITGAQAFAARLAMRRGGAFVPAPGPVRQGPRLALAGAPLGGNGLHCWLDGQGVLALDLQGPDAPDGDPADLLAAHRIDTLVWQVDPHDDLHGWRAPGLRRDCARLGIRFVDLGFVPTWPDASDLPEALPCA